MKKPAVYLKNIYNYIITCFITLFPTLEQIQKERQQTPLNPFPALRAMNWKATQYFLVGFLAWTWDAFDFFAVSLNASNIAKSLDRSVKDITWGITLVLMLRSVGAIIFGYIGDRYGRKYPYCINLGLLVVLQIGTGFVKTYKQFLGVRAIFGIAMGAVFGVASAAALENAPVECRSILSGIFQEGYALGYLLVVVFQRAITDNAAQGWRALFWFSSGPPVLFILWRLWLPESESFLIQKQNEKLLAKKGENVSFFHNAKLALRQYWDQLIYMVVLMCVFNFMSHGSQDLYPTMLTKQFGYGNDRSTVTNSVANLGAIAGGIIVAHASAFIGRRFAIVICAICGGALIYPWAFIHSSATNAAVFFLQFFVQGAWGVIPIHLTELSPAEFKALVVGTSYQLGNLASSASSTIEATIGERFPLYDENGKKIPDSYDYGKVMAIFMGCVFFAVLVTTLFGPENKNGEIHVSAAHLDHVFKENELDGVLDLENNAGGYKAEVEMNEEKAEVEHKN